MRIILADSDPRTVSALRILLKCEAGHSIVGEAMNTTELLELAQVEELDLVLLDWELNGDPNAGLLADLRDIHPTARVIALSGRPESKQAALGAGADVFVSKAEPASALVMEVTNLDKGDQTGKRAGRSDV
jgi:DNA-binding NarL/FixJ family response regulator